MTMACFLPPRLLGKTVISARLIAQLRVNTLVILHRRQLMDQWVDRLQSFFGSGEKGN